MNEDLKWLAENIVEWEPDSCYYDIDPKEAKVSKDKNIIQYAHKNSAIGREEGDFTSFTYQQVMVAKQEIGLVNIIEGKIYKLTIGCSESNPIPTINCKVISVAEDHVWFCSLVDNRHYVLPIEGLTFEEVKPSEKLMEKVEGLSEEIATALLDLELINMEKLDV